MSERTSYAPGTFSWTDLGTTDVTGAKAFYGGLFGWEAEDMPIGDAGFYTMFQLGGKNVAATHEQQREQRAQGVLPNWLSYVSVDDIEARAAKAKALGGTLVLEPIDVFDSGRMALLADPEGAMLGLWSPEQHIGAQLVNEPGTLGWNELATRDVAAAKRFYSGLFDWGTEEQDMGVGPYTVVKVGDQMNGGMLQMTEEWGEMPAHWMVYFGVADADASAARVAELGGQVRVPVTEIAIGRFAVVSDPQGAVFTIFQGFDTDA